MNKKTLALIVLLLILITLIFVFLINNKQKTDNPTVIFTPTQSQNPVAPSSSNNLQELILLNIDPAQDQEGKSPPSPIERITFSFNKSIDPSSVQITTTPQISLEKIFLNNSTELLIRPEGLSFWKPDILYTITLKRGLKSVDGFVLKEDIIYFLQAIIQGGI